MWSTTDPGGDVGAGVVAARQFTPQQVNPADGEGEHQHDQQHRHLQDTNTAELTFPCLLLFLYGFFRVCVFFPFVLGLLSLDTL